MKNHKSGILDFIRQNPKANIFCFVTNFILALVFTITLGARFGYDEIYEDVGKSDILAVFEGNVACPYTSLVPEKYIAAIKKIENVVEVASEIRQRYSFTNHENLTLAGMDPEKLLNFKDISIDEKEYEAFKNEPYAALVGRKIFRMYGWSLGEDIDAFGLRFKIAGVFEKPFSVYESMVFLHKDYLQQLTSKQGFTTSFLIKTDLEEAGLKGSGKLKVLMSNVEELFKNNPSKIVCRPEDELWKAIQASQGNLGDIISALCICLGVLLFIMNMNNGFLLLRHRFKVINELKNRGHKLNDVAKVVFVETAEILAFSGIMASVILYIALFNHPFYVGKDMFHPPIFVNSTVLLTGVLISLCSGVFAALAIIPGTVKAYNLN